MFHIPNTTLYIGSQQDMFDHFQNPDFVIVNTAGNLHAKILGGRPKSTDENYILYTSDRILSVNFVDADEPHYYNWQNNGVNVFIQILDFIDKSNTNVLINCNQGMSRSPSIAMLYLAKRKKTINDVSFEEAMKDFTEIYPEYNPGRGIHLFLKENWDILK